MSDARSNSNDFDPILLDLHLGQLSEPQRAELLQRVAREPALAAQHEALCNVFAALGCLREEVQTAGLAEKICVAVRSRGQPALRVARASAGEGERRGLAAWFFRVRSFRDILAVAAMLVLMIGLGVPGLLQVRERNQRIGCSWNLARLGQGMAAYASVFNDHLPFAGWREAASSWQPTNEPGVEVLPNRRHVYRLLPGGNVQPSWFVCPSRWDVPMSADLVRRSNDFSESRNLSYAYQNMAGVRPSLRDNPDLPVLADDNPLFDDGRPLFDWRRLNFASQAGQNSRAHGGAGQNILTLSGRVKWVTTPYAGLGDDNIWTLSSTTEYTGREGPRSTADSHLLK